jgi:tRNA(Leu) C34 or U34 (ribose-2'-O)-methylase TrmL
MFGDEDDGLYLFRQGRETRRGRLVAAAPAVVLINPKFPHNVGQAVRCASCYGVRQVWYSGSRVSLSGARLPREERLKGYEGVAIVKCKDPLAEILEAVPDAVPVAVEVRAGSEQLPEFEHPPNAVYVFGPEDSSLDGATVKRCHRFVIIPTAHCLNLATSVGTVLYDRMTKLGPRLSVLDEARRKGPR